MKRNPDAVRDAATDVPAVAPVTRAVPKESQVNKAAAARAKANADAHDRAALPKVKARRAKKAAAPPPPAKGKRAKAAPTRAVNPFAGMTRSERVKADPRFAAKVREWRSARRDRAKEWRRLGQDAQLVLDHGDAKALKALIAAAKKAAAVKLKAAAAPTPIRAKAAKAAN